MKMKAEKKVIVKSDEENQQEKEINSINTFGDLKREKDEEKRQQIANFKNFREELDYIEKKNQVLEYEKQKIDRELKARKAHEERLLLEKRYEKDREEARRLARLQKRGSESSERRKYERIRKFNNNNEENEALNQSQAASIEYYEKPNCSGLFWITIVVTLFFLVYFVLNIVYLIKEAVNNKGSNKSMCNSNNDLDIIINIIMTILSILYFSNIFMGLVWFVRFFYKKNRIGIALELCLCCICGISQFGLGSFCSYYFFIIRILDV